MADKKISQLTDASTPLAGTEVLPIVQGGSTVKVAVSDLTAGRNVSTADLTTTGNTILGNASSDTLNVGNGGFIKDANNNIGIGAAPSAWSGWGSPAIETANGVALVRAGNSAHSGTNWYYSGSNFIYKTNGYATWAREFNGGYEWYTAASGTAGNNITFNLGMKLDVNRDLTLSTGNFVPGTAAKGVNFTANTPAAGMTSQLLNAYEEGTWTPNQGSGLVVVGTFSSSGYYTRIGRLVTATFTLSGSTSITCGANGSELTSNLPFSAGSKYGMGVLTNGNNTATNTLVATNTRVYSNGPAPTATTALNVQVTYEI